MMRKLHHHPGQIQMAWRIRDTKAAQETRVFSSKKCKRRRLMT
jgi:hypothetical protein